MRIFEEVWFRGAGALRFGAKVYRNEWSVWLEMAGALPGKERFIPKEGGHKYDWQEHKIAYRLSREDLGKLGWALDTPRPGKLLELIHQYQGRLKQLSIVLADNGVFFFNGRQSLSGGKEDIFISVPLEGDGIWKLRQCIRLAYEEAICLQEKDFVKLVK